MISIVIPCHNTEQYINECINSVMANEWPDGMELVCVDNGSSDRTRTIINQYRIRTKTSIRLVEAIERKSPAYARNIGWKAARNPWIVFLDSDDYLLREFSESLLEELKREDADVFWFWSSHVHKRRCSIHSSNPKSFSRLDWRKRIRLINPITTSGTCVRRQCLEQVGGFDERLVMAEDWDLWIRLSECARFKEIKAVRVAYRIETGMTRKRDSLVRAELGVLKKYQKWDITLVLGIYRIAQIAREYCIYAVRGHITR